MSIYKYLYNLYVHINVCINVHMNVCLNVHINVHINANMNIYEKDPLVHLIVHIKLFRLNEC